MLQKEKPCVKSQSVKTYEQNEDVYIFLVIPKYHVFFFNLVLPFKIIQSLLERVQIHKYAGKPKNLWDLNYFSEEQQTV